MSRTEPTPPKVPATTREHLEKAREYLGAIRSTAGQLSTDQMLKAAQVHATIALAEATRTTNMLALGQTEAAFIDDVYRRVDN